MSDSETLLNAEEQELLQEIMNIAFGKAAADLAEVVDIFVVLSIPEVRLLRSTELSQYLDNALKEFERISVVEQQFWGEFRGSGYLVLPTGAGKELVALLGNTDPGTVELLAAELLEKETLLEVGNILIGACVGKLAELLGDTVTYNPPRVVRESLPREAMPRELWPPNSSAILLKTIFRFSGRNVAGLLFLLTSQDSMRWLRQALTDFLGRYA